MKRTVIDLINSVCACILVLALTVGCANQAQADKAVNAEKSNTDIKYNLVFADNSIDEYIAKYPSYGEVNEALFQETVITPIKHQYGVDFKNLYMKTITDVDNLKKEMSKFEKEKENIKKLIHDSLNECNKLLPADEEFTIYILPEDPSIYGRFNVPVRALTPVRGTMLLVINPSDKDFQKLLPYTVAHEFHHSMERSKVESYTLLYALIHEGKAESFAHLLFPKVKSKLMEELSEEEESKLWSEIKDNLQIKDTTYISKILNGSADNMRLFGGYRLGSKVVQEFINNNPEIGVKEWTNMESKDVFEKIKYKK